CRIGAQGVEERPEDALDHHGEVGDGGHDPGRRDEDVPRGMDTLHELLAEAFFTVADGCDSPQDRAEHDDVQDVITDLIHCYALFLWFYQASEAGAGLPPGRPQPALS